jgi:RNA polymerase sigma factor (sigma-70 family)
MNFCPVSERVDWVVDEKIEENATERTSSRRRPPLTSAQQALATRYLPMAKALAKPLKRSWPSEFDEFESAALLALVEAAQSFDPSRNVKFSTFARYRIGGALRDVQRNLIIAGWRTDSLHAPIISSIRGDSEDQGRVLMTEPDAPVGSEMESMEFVEAWLRKLPPSHASVCRDLFINGSSQGETAERLNCSKSRLSYLRKESLEMLKSAYEYDERRLEKKCRGV